MTRSEDPTSNTHTPRSLVVVVGPDSQTRRGLSHELIEGGVSVVLCSGPPGCPLVREEPCPLIETADVVAVLPTTARDREALTALSLCARRAAKAVVIEPTTVQVDGGVVRTEGATAEENAKLIGSVARHPSGRPRSL